MTTLSIITINYNNKSGLEKTIASVISQNFKDFEFIVIDGNSNDGSKEVIASFQDKISVSVSEADKGIYDAQNKGITMASGKYLLFLNSGDVLYNVDTLKSITPLLKEKSFYYGNLILEKSGKHEEHIAPVTVDMDFMLNSTFWHPCVFIKSDLFKNFGLYNTDFKIAGDYEFFIRCLLKPNISSEHLNQFVSVFDGNGISNDPKSVELLTSEREKAWKMNVSETVFENLKKQNAFDRSRYSKIINTIQKLRGK
ncbi:MAG: glycosyltransferase family 2 protein [Bacteroidota bacterium]|nr:glycosyltransferase family 2 protein [Bacteroidota bacterium]